MNKRKKVNEQIATRNDDQQKLKLQLNETERNKKREQNETHIDCGTSISKEKT